MLLTAAAMSPELPACKRARSSQDRSRAERSRLPVAKLILVSNYFRALFDGRDLEEEPYLSLDEAIELIPPTARLSEASRKLLTTALPWLADTEFDAFQDMFPTMMLGCDRVQTPSPEGSDDEDDLPRKAMVALRLLSLARFLLSSKLREEVLLWVTHSERPADCCRALVRALWTCANEEGYGLEDFLRDAQGDPCSGCCLAAGLQVLGPELTGHLPLVRQLFDQGPESVRIAMARTILATCPELVVTTYLEDYLQLLDSSSKEGKVVAAEALGRADKGSGVVPDLPTRLGPLLSDLHKPVRQVAAEALACLGENAVPILMEGLVDGDRITQESSSHALSLMGAPAVDALSELLETTEEGILHVWGLRTLAAIQPASLAEPHLSLVAAYLRDGSVSSPSTLTAKVQREALAVFSMQGQAAEDYASTIGKCLESSEWSVRAAAARTFAKLPEAISKHYLERIAALLSDMIPDVVEAAAATLAAFSRLAGPHAVQLAQVFSDDDDKASEAARRAFKSMLRSPSFDVREAAASALRGGQPEAILHLVPELVQVARNDEDRHVREEALRVLAGLGPEAPKAAVDVAAVLLQDTSTILRRAAVEALAAMGPAATAAHEEELRQLLVSAPGGLRRAVEDALRPL